MGLAVERSIHPLDFSICWLCGWLFKNARGMVELITGAIGFAEGIINLTMLSITVVIGFLTTIMAPVMSRPFINNMKGSIIIVDYHKKI